MICDAGDVVVVPFPFSEIAVAKPRPAVVVSPESVNRAETNTLLAMLTTAAGEGRPGDVRLLDLRDAGLTSACVMRLKLFTLDNRLISRRIGALSARDREAAKAAVSGLIAL